jgi:hypothetical protein
MEEVRLAAKAVMAAEMDYSHYRQLRTFGAAV